MRGALGVFCDVCQTDRFFHLLIKIQTKEEEIEKKRSRRGDRGERRETVELGLGKCCLDWPTPIQRAQMMWTVRVMNPSMAQTSHAYSKPIVQYVREMNIVEEKVFIPVVCLVSDSG